MQNISMDKIELYPPEIFKTLLDHEVNKSRRYGDSLTLIDILVEAEPSTPETQHSADAIAIELLRLHLRDADIPSKRDHEFLILMPSTGAAGARTACERIRKLLSAEHQTDSGTSFKLSTFSGMATLPHDHSISSDEFSTDASLALQHARTNHLNRVIAFSDIQT
jgi:hypothetical protein